MLQTATDPQEIALLTRNLEQAGAGQYHEESMNAASQMLDSFNNLRPTELT